ncbi:AsmA protein [Rhizomicrobium palustre]|uniref:AsmA protein n=1 Tax=Rhizomicrobium palustre TaxID=189966 RepID=A0A846MUF0_9PROT|nr:AsmA family protein [Rhizomicrobium palustre]NIK86859.1 AsmA protein [Rhizomicrobium palustre]
MSKIWRRILIAVGVLAALAVLVLAIPFLVPMDAYRGQIETAGATATGRTMKIEGPVRLTLYPHLGLKAQQVTLANVKGGKASVMVDVGDINLSLQLWPLLHGAIALDKIVLVKPVIALEVDNDGNPNWQFGKKTDKSEKKGTLTLPSGTRFNGIEISDGMVTYDNAKTKTHRAVEHVNLVVGITEIDQPVSLTGDLFIETRKLGFQGRLATLKSFLSSGTTNFALALDSELLKADFNGQMLPDGTTDGRFQMTSPSLRELSGWLGQKLPAGGLGALNLKSRIINKEKVTHLEALKVSLDGQNMTGDLTIDASNTVPVLGGTLNADRLNLTPYLEGGKTRAAPRPNEAWSREPISFALLKEFNGKLAFSTGSLTAQSLHLGRASLHLTVDNGLANIVLDQVSLYGGSGQGDMTIDARGKVPQFLSRSTLHNVELQPLLKDMLQVDAISGVGALTLDLRFAGSSPNAILHSLSGKGSLSAQNGRVKGVDLGRVAKTVSIVLGGDATGDVASTDFHDLGASFVLAQGVMSTNDFRLAGPVVEMTGHGGIDIGNKTIDFRVKPGAHVAGYGLAVPFRISGSWSKLHYAPDVGAIMEGASDSLKNGAAAIGALFGGGQKNGQKPEDKKKNTGNALKDLFGIH